MVETALRQAMEDLRLTVRELQTTMRADTVEIEKLRHIVIELNSKMPKVVRLDDPTYHQDTMIVSFDQRERKALMDGLYEYQRRQSSTRWWDTRLGKIGMIVGILVGLLTITATLYNLFVGVAHPLVR